MQTESTFPPPPKYYQLYTNENINLHRKGESDLELQPPEPITGDFTVFGQQDNTEFKLLSLEEMGLKKIDLIGTKKEQLTQINHNILTSFLGLLSDIVDGVDAAERIEQLRLLMIYMHHGLNEYRPHQARETLMMIMREQIEEKRDAAHEIDVEISRIKLQLTEIKSVLTSSGVII